VAIAAGTPLASPPATIPKASLTTGTASPSYNQPGPGHEEERAVSGPDEDFAAMFEASLKAKRIERGQTIEGTIVAIGPEVAFVDVGGKGEATIEIDELKDADGDLEVAVGGRIQATVVSTVGGLTLSRKLARGAATQRQLEDAFHTGLPVEGKVDKAVKGGYEVSIARQRAFCPISQIDTVRNTDPTSHEGRVYRFRIIEYKEGGKNLVVSRRALLEEEQRASAAEVRQSIVAGAVMTGRVTSVREFGAFVDLGGGVQGLLHVSEMGWSRVSDSSSVVRPGEEITVKVLRVDDDQQKISLGLKQLTTDPWSRVHATYEIGQVVTGRVTRLAEFGAFVELEPGIEGLAHASTFVSQAFPVGADVEVVVLEVDPAARRIRLSVKAAEDAHEAEELREYTEREDVTPAEGFGSLADKLRGALKPREK
jgi:small subunit ribosomal protein S1